MHQRNLHNNYAGQPIFCVILGIFDKCKKNTNLKQEDHTNINKNVSNLVVQNRESSIKKNNTNNNKRVSILQNSLYSFICGLLMTRLPSQFLRACGRVSCLGASIC
jgi:hypothetical protein